MPCVLLLLYILEHLLFQFYRVFERINLILHLYMLGLASENFSNPFTVDAWNAFFL